MQAAHCDHDVTFPSWSDNASAHIFGNGNALREAELLRVDTCLVQYDDDGCISINYDASF